MSKKNRESKEKSAITTTYTKPQRRPKRAKSIIISFLLIALALVSWRLQEAALTIKEEAEIINKTDIYNKTLESQLAHAKEFQNRCVKNGVAKYDEWGEIILLK